MSAPVESAAWPFSLPAETPASEVAALSAEVDRLAEAAQYGWGHTIDFGQFRKEGLLKEQYLRIAGHLDAWDWWPRDLQGQRVADVGCYTGGLSLLLAHRGAEVVYAVDEVPANLEQCAFLARVFETDSVRPVLRSTYGLAAEIEPRSLDLIVFSGVLYHLSDMLVGLFALRELLRPGGTLVLQSNALDDFDRSYANFGRFVAGRWWQPTARCVLDMLELMGFAGAEARMYGPEALLARATATSDELRFKRGLNWAFDDLRDRERRSLDATLMAPARPG